MIRTLVDFALNNRFVVIAIALLLIFWGAISFHQLPVEAYPDIADNYVTVITQWPGRSAEEVEQQVTIPIEVQMAGMPHMTFLRSESIFGLSYVIMIFDDSSVNDWNRQKVLERLTQVDLPNGQNLVPQIGTDWSTTGQIYWYTIRSTDPRYDLMQLRSIEDWVLLKQFKSVLNVVDVSDFGGTVREYQVRVDPNKLVSYGLSIGQVEQQLSNNNNNAGGSFVELGMQQMNVRALGLFKNVQDIENTVLTTKNGTALRVKDIAEVQQGPMIRLGHMARANHMEDGSIIDEPDVIQGGVLMRKGAEEQPTLDAIHQKVDELNNGILPAGVKVVPMLDRSDLLHFTLHTVMHNLIEGMVLVTIILLLFLLNARAAFIVALTIPFSLLFASICLDMNHIPANLLSLGALDFGMVVDGAVVMMENIIRHLAHMREQGQWPIRRTDRRDHPRGLPRGAAAGLLRHCHHHHRVYAHLHAATHRRAAVQAHGVDGCFRSAGRDDVLHLHCAGAGKHLLSRWIQGAAKPRDGVMTERVPEAVALGDRSSLDHCRGGVVAMAGTGYLGFSGAIGSEFLPHLDEGAIWARGTLANSTSLSGRRKIHRAGAPGLCIVSRGEDGCVAGRPAR
jgi:cobalt-zinc-cadmium resistance protein CzcA